MIRALRRFWLYAWLSYCGLFTWLNPWGYISTRVVTPITVELIFGSIDRYLGVGTARPAVGIAVYVIGLATVFGVNLAVANERDFGTLKSWLIAPQSLLFGLAAKAFPHMVDAFLGAALTLGTAVLAFSLPVHDSAVPSLLACAACAAVSSSGLGVAVAALSVRFRDVFTAPNVAECLLLTSSGAIVAPSALPAHLGLVGSVLPLSHAIIAAQDVVTGAGLPLTQLIEELLVGGVWGIAGYMLLRWMSASARSTAAYDMV